MQSTVRDSRQYACLVDGWSFLTNHAYVLYCVARQPGIRLVEIAASVGIRERAAHRIVAELEEAGYLTRHRMGARNFYEIHPDLPLRHELGRNLEIGDLLALLLKQNGHRSQTVADAPPTG